MDQTVRPDPSTVLDLLVDTVFAVDKQGRVLFVSASCEALLGFKPDELVGEYMIEHVHPDDRALTLNAVWRMMSGDAIQRLQNRWMHKDGHPVSIEWTARWSAQHKVRVAVARVVIGKSAVEVTEASEEASVGFS